MSPTFFNQLGLVSSLLAGFAFAFLGSLLAATVASRVYALVFASALLAALALMVAAIASVFAGLAVEGKSTPEDLLTSLHQLASQAFLLGTLCLVVAAGLVGWLRSKGLGLLSGVLAGVALIVLGSVLAPFLKLQ